MSGSSATTMPARPPASALWFLKRALGFWKGPQRSAAWTLTVAALLLVLANLAVNVGINYWNRWFFDALERKDASTLSLAVITIVGLIAVGAAFAVAMVRCRMTLQVRWRQWLTGELLERWLSDQRYYRLAVSDEEQINPEYRIADDLRLASEPVIEFAIGFINATLAALAFVGILFWIGGSLTVQIGGVPVWIPGYIALAAVLYAAAVTAFTYFIGKPLVDRVATKNESEAQFRYELTRVRENSESIALIKGADDERKQLNETFAEVVSRWLGVMRQHGHLTWMLNSSTFFHPSCRAARRAQILHGRVDARRDHADRDRVHGRADRIELVWRQLHPARGMECFCQAGGESCTKPSIRWTKKPSLKSCSRTRVPRPSSSPTCRSSTATGGS